MSSEKIKVVHVDIGGCEGCSVSFLRSLPLISDKCTAKTLYTVDSIDELFENDVDIAFVSGSVCLNDEEVIETLKNIREKAKILAAFGSCASFGGVTRFSRGGQEPKPSHRTFAPLNQVVEVEYSIPGCPPPPQTVNSFMIAYQRQIVTQLAFFSKLSEFKKLSGFDLIDDIVLTGLCMGCGACEVSCPTGAIKLIERRPNLIVEKCIRCGTCYVRCPRAMQLLIRGVKK